MHHGLIDELRMWVHPVVWGSGERPFKDAGDRTFLRLVDTTTFGSGVVVLSYQPE
jgi:dihydrofolate reductase